MPHAYLLIGNADKTALEYAKRAVCSNADASPCGVCKNCTKAERGIHPDIIYLRKNEDKAEMTVDVIRSLTADVTVVPNEAERKVYILPDAALMNANASNAFLKLLEEPPKYVVFILMGSRLKDFLPTIRSRCVVVQCGQPETANIEDSSADAIFAAFQKRDAIAIAAECVKLEKSNRETIAVTLNALYHLLAKNAAEPEYMRAIEVITPYVQMLRSRVNLSPAHIAAVLMVELNRIVK